MKSEIEAIVIGASAGAVGALSIILPKLSKQSPPVMVVVHLPADQKSLMVEIMRPKCEMNVQEAEDKVDISNGNIYFAPPDYHLLVETNKQLSLSSEEPECFSRPSINALFETAADAYGEKLIGIILTGANEDGAKGLRAVIDAGGVGLVQIPSLSYTPEMPTAALKLCPEARAFDLDQIAAFLQESVMP